MEETARPSLVILRSHIGWPSPKYTDTAHAHGNPLGEDEVARGEGDPRARPRRALRRPRRRARVLPRGRARAARSLRADWEQRRAAFRTGEPEMSEAYDACLEQRGLPGWEAKLPSWTPGEQVATREACSTVLDAILDVVPGIVSGGADLTGNTGTELEDADVIATHVFGGRQAHWGVREHGMGSVMNGMAVSGTLPVGGTFFVFSDYMRGAVRLAALSGYKVAFVWSHDSVGVGEDGPTHQPVEHLAALRAMPGLRLIRAADANEVAQAWRVHLDGDGPTAIILTRQNVPVLEGTAERAPEGVPAGAYVARRRTAATSTSCSSAPGPRSRCASPRPRRSPPTASARASCRCRRGTCSRPRTTSYREQVLPAGVPTARRRGRRLVRVGPVRRRHGRRIDRFGASAPGATVMTELGITAEHVVDARAPRAARPQRKELTHGRLRSHD